MPSLQIGFLMRIHTHGNISKPDRQAADCLCAHTWVWAFACWFDGLQAGEEWVASGLPEPELRRPGGCWENIQQNPQPPKHQSRGAWLSYLQAHVLQTWLIPTTSSGAKTCSLKSHPDFTVSPCSFLWHSSPVPHLQDIGPDSYKIFPRLGDWRLFFPDLSASLTFLIILILRCCAQTAVSNYSRYDL